MLHIHTSGPSSLSHLDAKAALCAHAGFAPLTYLVHTRPQRTQKLRATEELPGPVFAKSRLCKRNNNKYKNAWAGDEKGPVPKFGCGVIPLKADLEVFFSSALREQNGWCILISLL